MCLKKLMQGGLELVFLGRSATGIECYPFWLHGVCLIITSNSWGKELPDSSRSVWWWRFGGGCLCFPGVFLVVMCCQVMWYDRCHFFARGANVLFRTGKKEGTSCFFYTFWNCTFAFPIVSMCRLLSGAQVDSLLCWYRAAKRERRFGLYFESAACIVTSDAKSMEPLVHCGLWCKINGSAVAVVFSQLLENCKAL